MISFSYILYAWNVMNKKSTLKEKGTLLEVFFAFTHSKNPMPMQTVQNLVQNCELWLQMSSFPQYCTQEMYEKSMLKEKGPLSEVFFAFTHSKSPMPMQKVHNLVQDLVLNSKVLGFLNIVGRKCIKSPRLRRKVEFQSLSSRTHIQKVPC